MKTTPPLSRAIEVFIESLADIARVKRASIESVAAEQPRTERVIIAEIALLMNDAYNFIERDER